VAELPKWAHDVIYRVDNYSKFKEKIEIFFDREKYLKLMAYE